MIVSPEAFLNQPDGENFVRVAGTLTLTDRVDGCIGFALCKGDEALNSHLIEAFAATMQGGSYGKTAATYAECDNIPLQARQ